MTPLAWTDERSLLIDDAARSLGVSRRTVYYWIRDGRLRTIRTRGGSQRVLCSSIDAWARVREVADAGSVPDRGARASAGTAGD